MTDHFLGRRLRHGVEQRKLALFRVGSGLYERIDENDWSQLHMEIHEHSVIEGKVGEIGVPVDHQDYKGLGKFVAKHRDYALWQARRYELLRDNVSGWEDLTSRQRFKYRHVISWWFPWFFFFLLTLLNAVFSMVRPAITMPHTNVGTFS